MCKSGAMGLIGELRCNNLKCHFFLPILPTKFQERIRTIKEMELYHVSEFGNVFTLRTEYCTYVIFLSFKKKSTVNITGVRNFRKIFECISNFLLLFSLYSLVRKRIQFYIDNVSGSSRIKQPKDSRFLFRMQLAARAFGSSLTFYRSRFPGITIRVPFLGTLIIFFSGKVNFVGCRSKRALKELAFFFQDVNSLCEKLE